MVPMIRVFAGNGTIGKAGWSRLGAARAAQRRRGNGWPVTAPKGEAILDGS
jgi:hypothetical protein